MGKKGLLYKYGYGNLSWEPWHSGKIRRSGVCDSVLGGEAGTSSLCLARNLSLLTGVCSAGRYAVCYERRNVNTNQLQTL